jgi:hypothetical protein
MGAAVFGCTDETYGYVMNLQFQPTCRKRESGNGAGVIKNVDYTAHKTLCTGEYVYVGDDANDPLSQVGSGTAITLSDAESPGNIYIDSAAKILNGGPETATEMRVRFTGTYYPDLAA